MAYKHGVIVSEVPTTVLPPVEVSAAIPIVFGTAPVNMTDPTCVNKPVLAYSYDEAVAALGYVPPAEQGGVKKHAFTLCEAIKSQFALFAVSPIILVNVLDPKTHKTAATTQTVTLDAKTGQAVIAEAGILPDSVTITPSNASAYVKDTDYVLSFDGDGNLVVASLTEPGGTFKCTTGGALTFAAQKLDPAAVKEDAIVGGVDVSGNKSGLELVDECFPRFGIVPGTIVAPGFSSKPEVAAVMAAKATSINDYFRAICLIDIPTDKVKAYTDVAKWKTDNNITDRMQVACWPMLSLDGTVYNMSSQLMALLAKVDAENDDTPYVSPSNKGFKMTAAVLEDGTEVWLGPDNGEYLNGQGVVTALNFMGGWKCWGNRTAAYPATTDVKDSFICIRRMFNWIGNTLTQTFWQKLDAPANRRLIDTVILSANVWLNGLAARQYILGGRVEFLESENPVTSMMDGKFCFHVYVTPPSPAREIDFVLEYDVNNLTTLYN